MIDAIWLLPIGLLAVSLFFIGRLQGFRYAVRVLTPKKKLKRKSKGR